MLQFIARRLYVDIVKQWYDGYFLAIRRVCNPGVCWPWFCLVSNERKFSLIRFGPIPPPNSIIVKENLVEQYPNISVKRKLESLIEGHSIEKQVHEDNLCGNFQFRDNLWNFYFHKTMKQIGHRHRKWYTIYGTCTHSQPGGTLYL